MTAGQSVHLRVLFVISRLDRTGGAGRSVAELVMSLHRLGVQTELACFQRMHGGLEEELEESGIPVYSLNADHLVTAIWHLRRLVRRLDPDLVHTTMYSADQAGRVAAWRTGTPVISSVINPTHDPALLVDDTCPLWRRRMMWAIDGWTARHLASRLHTITDAVKRSAARGLRIDPDRITTVYRSRDARRLGSPDASRRASTRRALGADDASIILTIGRQTQQKGQIHLVDAFARLAPTRRDAILLIAGAVGSATPQIEARVLELGLTTRVRLLGFREDIGDLLTAADVFAFPSLYEGLGGAVIEAMALATPVVASDLPAIREATGDGDGALLVPPGEDVALADALERVLTDRALATSLAARGRRQYLRCFTPERTDLEMIEMYAAVLSQSQAGSHA